MALNPHFPPSPSLSGISSQRAHVLAHSVVTNLLESRKTGSYLYAPLNDSRAEIRLLEILPDSGVQTISCSLRSVSLQSNPEYVALSYTWGNPSSSRLIDIDGCPLPVTDNLYDFLRAMRINRPKVALWVDQICINQKNLHEKSSQIRLIADIYSSAQSVIAWLGE
ncbi:HET-domain-containing protein, partial [Lophium mytilinum]